MVFKQRLDRLDASLSTFSDPTANQTSLKQKHPKKESEEIFNETELKNNPPNNSSSSAVVTSLAQRLDKLEDVHTYPLIAPLITFRSLFRATRVIWLVITQVLRCVLCIVYLIMLSRVYLGMFTRLSPAHAVT